MSLSSLHEKNEPEPWYKQFWPWFLIALPGSVVIAAIATLYIAIQNPQPLVKEEYYKDGLAINRDMEKELAAARAGLQAHLSFSEDKRIINIALSRLKENMPLPEQIYLAFIHPADDTLDINLLLNLDQDSLNRGTLYSGIIDNGIATQIGAQRWYIQIEPSTNDKNGLWLLKGEIPSGTTSAVIGETLE
ncbi:MAG: FixH family protein [Pseudomonadales bacterium]|nr:FixH family protein [Pseudomonadales bacterium]